MAGRLGGRSNASLCKRVLDHTRLNGSISVCSSGEPRLLLADQIRYSGVLSSNSIPGNPLRKLDGEPEEFCISAAEGCTFRGPSTVRVRDFIGTRSIAVRHLEKLYHQLGKRFRGFSTVQEVQEQALSSERKSKIDNYPTSGDLILPKLENPTIEWLNSVCQILEKLEWGQDAIKELEESGVVFSPYLVELIVQKISKDVDLTWNFFMWAREKATKGLSLRAYIAVLGSLGHAKNLELMKELMKFIIIDGHRKSAWPYNNALKWFSEDVDTALYFWALMKENKSRPTVITYTRLIDVLARHGKIEEASEIFRQMLQDGCPPNITTYNVLIHAFGATGQPEAASALFDKLSELGCKPNSFTYNTLIGMHVKAGNTDVALKYFNALKATGGDIGKNVYRALQMSLPEGNFKEGPPGEEIGNPSTEASVGALSVPEVDYNLNSTVLGSQMSPWGLVNMLEKGEHISCEEKLAKIQPRIYPRFVVQVLQRIKNPNTALIFFDWAKQQPYFQHNEYSYSLIISILGRSRDTEAIDRTLREMQEQGIKINTAIFTSLITCYGRAKSIDGALHIFQQMKDSGCKPDVITYTSLIHLLAKHGRHEQATEMFKEMLQVGCLPNSHTYSVMIYNLLKSGKVTEAFELLTQMPELGCKPTPVTYATLIHHCAKEGHVDVAIRTFDMMEKEGVKPLKVSVTDLDAALRKAGRLEEAETLGKKLKPRRYWDETYKAPTEKVARELVFKNFIAGYVSSEADTVQI